MIVEKVKTLVDVNDKALQMLSEIIATLRVAYDRKDLVPKDDDGFWKSLLDHWWAKYEALEEMNEIH